jgi:hypothetical protein
MSEVFTQATIHAWSDFIAVEDDQRSQNSGRMVKKVR